ncbi:MAG: type II secretion system secretin GspD [Woeseiaceae bacterium]|nr:type II secretion system secretin GspD [Woeseiaceae bacterium]
MNNFRTRARTPRQGIASLLLAACFVLSAAHAQQPTITPNYKDADLRQIIEAVGEVTGRNFLIDPRVEAKVTMLSATPMTPDAFYEAFLSILEVHGYVALPSEGLIKILPNASARQYPGLLSTSNADADDIVTQVIQVQNIAAAQLVPILRPLIPQYGHLAAHPGSNMLIISDRAANVTRMISIIRRIDQSNDDEIEVVPLNNASASEVVRVLTALTQTPRADGMPVTTSLVADARTNSVLIGGERSERLRLRALIAHLDTPLEDGGDTQVRYLRYADAEELTPKLQQHFTQQATAGAGAQGGGSAAGAAPVSVWADPQTNAIIVNAPPKMMRSLMGIVDKLDIRRAQVLVEAIIVEVTADKASELGVTWAVDGSGSNSAIGVTNFGGAGTNIIDLAGLAGSDGAVDPSVIGQGITAAVGRISDSSTSFAAILSALEGDADTNIISTPTLVTTDNEEASINVGQEVPFVTGSFTNTGTGGGGGAVNPFQTIQREQVGVKLTLTPQINEGNAVLLKISQEISKYCRIGHGRRRRPDHERAHDRDDGHRRGRWHPGPGRPDRGHAAREHAARADTRPGAGAGRPVSQSQRAEGQDQPDGIHPAQDSAGQQPDRDRDRCQVQLYPGHPAGRQRAAAAWRRAPDHSVDRVAQAPDRCTRHRRRRSGWKRLTRYSWWTPSNWYSRKTLPPYRRSSARRRCPSCPFRLPSGTASCCVPAKATCRKRFIARAPRRSAWPRPAAMPAPA